MAKTFGKATITINGEFQDSFQGVTFNPGGTKRNPVKGAHTTNYSEEEQEAKLEFEASITQGTSIKTLDLGDATIQIKMDTGQTYVMNHAFRTDPPDLPDTGKSKYTFNSEPATEIL